MVILQRDGFQVLEKEFLSCETGKRLGNELNLKAAEICLVTILPCYCLCSFEKSRSTLGKGSVITQQEFFIVLP
jgi:hypothetical protein